MLAVLLAVIVMTIVSVVVTLVVSMMPVMGVMSRLATVIVVNTDMARQRSGPGIVQLTGPAGTILPHVTPKG